MPNKKFSIITLCYNQLENATKPFINSLYENTDKNEFELIIINNNSQDGTKEFLEQISKKYDNIRIIHNDSNLGYSKGCNQGLKIAAGEYIVLVNNDALFTPNWIEKCSSIFNLEKSIGLVAPLTNSSTIKAQKIKNYKSLTAKNYITKYKNLLPLHKKYQAIPVVIFFCVMIKKEVLEHVGCLDENFGLAWYEDDDYCNRLRNAGYQIVLARNVFIYHNHSKTSSLLAKTKEGQELVYKNQNYFFEKHKKEIIDNNFKKLRQKICITNQLIIIQLLLTALMLVYFIFGKA